MGLFDPLWRTEKRDRIAEAVAEVHHVENMDELVKIAENAYFPEVQCAAVEKIEDPALLREIIYAESSSFDAKKAAVRKIHVPAMLAEIASERKAYPADGEAVALLTDQDLLKEIAMREQGGEQAKAVYKITDQRTLAEIAAHALKGDARKTAFRSITDPDILMDLIDEADSPFMKESAYQQLAALLDPTSGEPKAVLNKEERSRFLGIILTEKNRDVPIPLWPFAETSLLEKIFREAAREDLRMDALSVLLADSSLPSEKLLDFWRIADRAKKESGPIFTAAWNQSLQEIMDALLSLDWVSLEPLLAFVRDPDSGSAAACVSIKILFDREWSAFREIDAVRDEAVSAYLANLPAYEQADLRQNMKSSLYGLIQVLPDSVWARYGLGFTPAGTDGVWTLTFLRKKFTGTGNPDDTRTK